MGICSAPKSVVAVAQSPSRRLVIAAGTQKSDATHAAAHAALSRRVTLAGAAAAATTLLTSRSPAAAAEEATASSAAASIKVLEDQPGSGTAEAQSGDLVMVHYVGVVAADGTLFDSTLGGEFYRDGGKGKLRPVLVTLGGPPVPGICAGLQQGIEGMRVGGRRTFAVPPALGFGAAAVLGPYGVVPGGSELRYKVRLLRLSRRGPDALMSGVSQCGAGFANERTGGCADIEPAEFL